MRVMASGFPGSHPKHGPHCKVHRIKLDGFGSPKELIAYISGKSFFDIGPKTAGALVKHFGMDVIEILDYFPDRILEVPGIGKKRRVQLVTEWTLHRTKHRVTEDLCSMGLSQRDAERAIRRLGNNAVNIVNEDPYVLISIDGISFKVADVLAWPTGSRTIIRSA